MAVGEICNRDVAVIELLADELAQLAKLMARQRVVKK